MKKPQVYYVDGTAVAIDGIHVFKEAISGCGIDICEFQKIAEVIILTVDSDGLYYLQKEGVGLDAGEKYLLATGNIVASGIGDDGSICSILSPYRAYKNYKQGIEGIKELLSKTFKDDRVDQILLRLLFIGVCGEFEGYLYTALISLIQGSRDAFIAIRDCRGLHSESLDEEQWRNEIVKEINDKFLFQHIRNRNSREIEVYEKLIGESITITQELEDYIVWRNKLAHKVPFYEKTLYPSREDVLNFINETDKVVDLIDTKIGRFKFEWFSDI